MAHGTAHAQEGAPKKRRKKTTYLPTYLPAFSCFLRSFEIFRSDFGKYFYLCFWAPQGCRETAKNAIKKSKGKVKRRQKKSFVFLNFFGQFFLTWISPKKFLMVFLKIPCCLLRNAQKRQ
jgi:hypothetical protein